MKNDNKQQGKNAHLAEERLLRVSEVAEILGVQPRTIRRYMQIGWPGETELRFVRIGRGVVRYRHSDVMAYLRTLSSLSWTGAEGQGGAL